MDNVLVVNSDNYRGKYVATPDWDNNEVICSSEIPITAYNEAKEKGYSTPIILYVPYEHETTKITPLQL